MVFFPPFRDQLFQYTRLQKRKTERNLIKLNTDNVVVVVVGGGGGDDDYANPKTSSVLVAGERSERATVRRAAVFFTLPLDSVSLCRGLTLYCCYSYSVNK